MSTYVPRRETLGPFWHQEWEHDARVNSRHGNTDAKAHGLHRIDNDFQLSADGVWINAHGWPSKAFGTGIRAHTWEQISRRNPGPVPRNARQAFNDAAEFGQDVEAEIKHIPGVTNPELRAAFARMAASAEAAFGDRWRRRVVVKVLTNLTGGERYALRVCAAADEADLSTMLLVRGRAVAKSYAGHDEVTYIRGSVNPRVRR